MGGRAVVFLCGRPETLDLADSQKQEEDEEWALSSTHRVASQPEKGQYFAVQRSYSFDCDFASMRPHGEIAHTSLKESEGSDSEKTATAR